MQLYVFWRPAPMPFRRLPSLRSEERTRCGNQGGPGMKCPACGAEMHLMKVAPDKPMMVPVTKNTPSSVRAATIRSGGLCSCLARLSLSQRANAAAPASSAQTSGRWRDANNCLVTRSRGRRPSQRHVRGRSAHRDWAGRLNDNLGSRSKGPMGDRGPPGPKGATGDPGHPSAVSSVRIIRSNCDQTGCRVQCGESEMLLTAYCGPKRNTAIMPTERAATCRAAGPGNSPRLAVCARIEP